MAKSYINISLDDEKATQIAEVIGNKTCKQILQSLSEENATESELSEKLKLPLNTIGYNIKKLTEAGFIEQDSHWWSIRGKKVPVYRVANKSIIISPKKSFVSKIKPFVPVFIVTGLASFGIWIYDSIHSAKEIIPIVSDRVYEASPAMSAGVATTGAKAGELAANLPSPSIFASIPTWQLFLAGAWLALLIFILINWRKI